MEHTHTHVHTEQQTTVPNLAAHAHAYRVIVYTYIFAVYVMSCGTYTAYLHFCGLKDFIHSSMIQTYINIGGMYVVRGQSFLY